MCGFSVVHVIGLYPLSLAPDVSSLESVDQGGIDSVRLSFSALGDGITDADAAKYRFIIPHPEVGEVLSIVSTCPAASSSSDRRTYGRMNESSYAQ
jgi:hypothetical protein